MNLYLVSNPQILWRSILLLLLVTLCQVTLGQSDMVKPLGNQWMVYEEEASVFVPYLPNRHQQLKQLHLPLRLSDYESFYLTIKVEGASDLLINNRLVHVFPTEASNQQLTVKISDWLRYEEESSPESLITLHAKEGKKMKNIDAYLTLYEEQQELSRKGIVVWQPLKREGASKQYTFTFLGLGLLVIFTVFYRIPSPIFNMAYLGRYLSGFTKLKNEGSRIDAAGFFMFNAFYILSITYLTGLLNPDFLSVAITSENIISWDLAERFLGWLLWITPFLAAKWMAIWISGILYDYRRGINIHIQEFMNINQLYYLGALMLFSILHFSNILFSPQIREIALYSFAISQFFVGGLLSYRINKNLPFKKLYLISYLCGTEFFPTLLLVKYFVLS